MKLLVVDDDPDALVLASFLLSRVEGWSVLTAPDGATALETAERERPDLILLDYFLGEDNGLDVLARLRSRTALAPIPVIFLTGKGEALGEILRQAGARGVISKPFDPATLAEQVTTLLATGGGGEGPATEI